MKLNFWKWIKYWFALRKELKEFTCEDASRIMKLLKIGIRELEKESRKTPGPEITPKTLVALKMLSEIDKPVKNECERISSLKKLLQLNHTLSRKKRK